MGMKFRATCPHDDCGVELVERTPRQLVEAILSHDGWHELLVDLERARA